MADRDGIATRLFDAVLTGHPDPSVRAGELASVLNDLRQACFDAHSAISEVRTAAHWQKLETIAAALSDAALVSSLLSDMLNEDGTTELAVVLDRRKAGAPIDWQGRSEKASAQYCAARLVEFLCSRGWKREAAIERAVELSNKKGRRSLGRREIFEALATRRRARHLMPDLAEWEIRAWAQFR